MGAVFFESNVIKKDGYLLREGERKNTVIHDEILIILFELKKRFFSGDVLPVLRKRVF